jgi:hypothetical protein
MMPAGPRPSMVAQQAMSICRKFGVSWRSEAIGHARNLGLLVD